MRIVNELLKELGISKVKLAKYLGVSRQMVYNYLEMKSIDEWPKDKKTKFLLLFNVETTEELEKIKPTNESIMRIDRLLAESESDNNIFTSGTTGYEFKDLGKKQQKVVYDIVNLLKELLSEDDSSETAYNICRYFYYFLQVIDNVEELKFILAYFAKSNGFIDTQEFVFSEDKQVIFEGIMYQAIALFNSGSVSKQKVLEAHKKFRAEIEQKHEEKLSRTEELNTVKIQALRELGYTEVNKNNVAEVFEKMAEIESRKI